jgi:phage terminase small subunit
MSSSDEPYEPSPRPLTARQRRFAEEYLCDLNATAAAKRAGYSAHTASVIGYELTHHPEVAAVIEQLKAERAARLKCTADRVLEELAALGFSDIRHYGITHEGQLKRTPGAPNEASRAIQSMKRKVIAVTENGNEEKQITESAVEFKLYDKVRALELIGKHLGMFIEQVDIKSGGVPIKFTLAIGDRPLHES